MEIKKIGIAGSGTMGSSLAETFAKFGYDVYLYDIAAAQLDRAERLIALNQETEVAEGGLTPEKSKELLSRQWLPDNYQYQQSDCLQLKLCQHFLPADGYALR